MADEVDGQPRPGARRAEVHGMALMHTPLASPGGFFLAPPFVATVLEQLGGAAPVYDVEEVE